MKNVLYQLGDTAANLEGSTPAEQASVGMGKSTPAATPAATPPIAPVAPAPVAPAVATDSNFSPSTKANADYIYGSETARGL